MMGRQTLPRVIVLVLVTIVELVLQLLNSLRLEWSNDDNAPFLKRTLLRNRGGFAAQVVPVS